jgi:uncharacterized ion transporter superfamily protein YfcC
MEKEDKKKALLEVKMFLATIILLAVLIAVSGICSYVIPAGAYEKAVVNGVSQQVYHTIAQTPLPVWKIALSPFLVLGSSNGAKIIVLILFIFIIGGSFSIMNKSGILPRLISDLVMKFADRKRLFIFINVAVFALLGSTMGILEEVTPLILIFIPLAYQMKWDSIVGVAIPFVSVTIGFSAATFNPFTLGTAQKLADIPLFSGLYLRVPILVVTIFIVAFYILWYIRRIEKNPEKSFVYGSDREIKALTHYDDVVVHEGKVKPALICMGVCFLAIIGVVGGGSVVKTLQDLSFPLIALIFLIMGFSVGLVSGYDFKKVFKLFKDGLIDFSPAIILILMASSIGWLIVEGNIMATMMHFVSLKTQGLSREMAAILMYLFQLFMNFLVSSGSGQAMLTIPIMSQLGDILGLTRQITVLAFQLGDGFSHAFWPTNPLLMVVIGLAGIKYKDWFKFMLPLQVILAITSIIFLLIAVKINYS